MRTVKVAVAVGAGLPMELRDYKIADPKGSEVLIRTLASGICHTDLLLRDGLMGIDLPAVPGHEGAGIVEATGPGVKNLQVGDYVGFSQNYCGYCHNCQTAHPMNCRNYMQYNLTGKRPDGSSSFDDVSINANFVGQSSFGTYFLGSENNAVKLPSGLSATLAAPIGCGLVTGAGAVLNAMKPPVGSSIAVYGMGAVGLAAIMAAKISGCSTIIAIDIIDWRLDLAAELGATHALRGTDEDLVEKIQALTGGGTDFAVDAVGVPSVLAKAAEATCRGGFTAALGLNGIGHYVPIKLETVAWNRRIQGLILGDQIPQIFMPQLIQYYLNGQFPFDRLIRPYPFVEINRAIADAESGMVIKPVLVFDSP